MTDIENSLWNILDHLGFIVLKHRTDLDPPNSCYYQWRVNNYRLDFAILSLKIAIEADGRYWHRGIQKINDQIRDQKIRKHGWKIIRLSDQRIDKKHIESAILRLIDV